MKHKILAGSRRRFLNLSAGAACAMAAGAAWFKATSQTRELKPFERTSWALGTDITIAVLHTSETDARQAVDAALVEINAVEDSLSLYRAHSELSRLNCDGVLARPSAHFLTVLNACQAMSRQSGGAFDATVQPLWELYFDAKKARSLPTAEQVEFARSKVNWSNITAALEQVKLHAPGMKLTFNGIAQGYAADRAMAVLKAHRIEHALIDAGEFEPLGRKADGSAYRCGIQHPRRPDRLAGSCALEDRALATSGDYATAFSDDFVYHHIFNPATGRSPLECASVSILAPTGILADALSTAVFVLGREKGLALLASFAGCDAFVIAKDGSTVATPGFGMELTESPAWA